MRRVFPGEACLEGSCIFWGCRKAVECLGQYANNSDSTSTPCQGLKKLLFNIYCPETESTHLWTGVIIFHCRFQRKLDSARLCAVPWVRLLETAESDLNSAPRAHPRPSCAASSEDLHADALPLLCLLHELKFLRVAVLALAWPPGVPVSSFISLALPFISSSGSAPRSSLWVPLLPCPSFASRLCCHSHPLSGVLPALTCQRAPFWGCRPPRG